MGYRFMSTHFRIITGVLLTALLMLSGCSTVGLKQSVDGVVPLDKAVAQVPDDQLLDVWIELFEPGEIPDDPDDALGLSMDIRDAEARYIPQHLRNTLESTGYWGAVRVVPAGTVGGEVLVRGRILESDGLNLSLNIIALDATGRQWFDRSYSSEISYLAYQNSRSSRSSSSCCWSKAVTSCSRWTPSPPYSPSRPIRSSSSRPTSSPFSDCVRCTSRWPA